MSKYLDYNGLQYLWTKIEEYVSTCVDDGINPKETINLEIKTNQPTDDDLFTGGGKCYSCI